MTEAHKQGEAAYKAGKSSTQNPYASGTTEHDDWQEGWWETKDRYMG
jgi:ribosome modulation factor